MKRWRLRVSLPAPNPSKLLTACWIVWGGNWKCRAEPELHTGPRHKSSRPDDQGLLHGFTAIKSGSHAVVVAVPVPLCPLAATPDGLATVKVPPPNAAIRNVPLLPAFAIPAMAMPLPACTPGPEARV